MIALISSELFFVLLSFHLLYLLLFLNILVFLWRNFYFLHFLFLFLFFDLPRQPFLYLSNPLLISFFFVVHPAIHLRLHSFMTLFLTFLTIQHYLFLFWTFFFLLIYTFFCFYFFLLLHFLRLTLYFLLFLLALLNCFPWVVLLPFL